MVHILHVRYKCFLANIYCCEKILRKWDFIEVICHEAAYLDMSLTHLVVSS